MNRIYDAVINVMADENNRSLPAENFATKVSDEYTRLFAPTVRSDSKFDVKFITAEDIAIQIYNEAVRWFTQYFNDNDFKSIPAFDDLKKRTRKREYVMIRFFVVVLLYENRRISMTQEAACKILGYRDHTAIIHARRAIDDYCASAKEFRRCWEGLQIAAKLLDSL